MTKIKICGITNLEDALAACDAGADALGFVFAPEAKARNRYIDPADALALCEKLPPFVLTVAVCVNEPVERLHEYRRWFDRVQLCGEEDAETCAAVGPRAIKVFHMGPELRPEVLSRCPASACLLDASVPGHHGGTGATCDWAAARRIVEICAKPVILAGGLTPENVADAVRTVRPYAVDASGGVERAPGRKDHDRIRQFILNARLSVS